MSSNPENPHPQRLLPPRYWHRGYRQRLCPRSDDPRLQPGFGTLSDILDVFPDELKRRREAYRPVTSYPCGVSLVHEREKACYRIRFQPTIADSEFKPFFAEQLKPLLIERHLLEDGHEVRFHYQPATRDWVMRYLNVACDAEGREIIVHGKPKWVSNHRQVQAIAEEVAAQAAALLTEKAGPHAACGREF
jgi:hypothetical protein